MVWLECTHAYTTCNAGATAEWHRNFSHFASFVMQVAPFDLLDSLERMREGVWQQPETESATGAQQILSMAGKQ